MHIWQHKQPACQRSESALILTTEKQRLVQRIIIYDLSSVMAFISNRTPYLSSLKTTTINGTLMAADYTASRSTICDAKTQRKERQQRSRVTHLTLASGAFLIARLPVLTVHPSLTVHLAVAVRTSFSAAILMIFRIQDIHLKNLSEGPRTQTELFLVIFSQEYSTN